MKPALRDLLAQPHRFIVVAELVTSRGVITESRGQRVLKLAHELADSDRVDVLSMTDNPAGNAMIAADTMGTDLISRGQEVIIHLACKDWNRNALESRAWKLASEGFDNVLALSGDAPVAGYKGAAAAVFDIDSVGLLRMYSDMNEARPRADDDFCLGCVVTNHKRNENEVMPQLLKLRKKVDNGARFVITQIGYNARKDHELLRWMRDEGIDVPVLANVFVLSPGAARAFNAGRVPGVQVSDELHAIVQRETAGPDGGHGFFLDLAARQVAIARGLGFRGAYLGGHLEAPDYLRILGRAEAYASRLARARAPDPVRRARRVVPLRARRAVRALVRPGQQGVSQVAQAPPRTRRAAGYKLAGRCTTWLRRGRAAVRRRPSASMRRREGPRHRRQDAAHGRAGHEGADVRLSRLRRLLAARHRLPLPGVPMRQEPAQRSVRRHTARQPLRSHRQGLHLVTGLRPPQGLRRRADDARRARRDQGQRPCAHQRLGQHLPRPRPPRRRRRPLGLDRSPARPACAQEYAA